MKRLLCFFVVIVSFMFACPKNSMAQDCGSKYAKLSKLADDAFASKDYVQAINYSERLLKIEKRRLGEEHSNYVNTLFNIGWAYSQLEYYQKALKCFLRCAEIEKRTIGEENQNYVITMTNIGDSYVSINELDKALECYIQCAEINEKTIGKDHPDNIDIIIKIGVIYNALGNYPASAIYFQNVEKNDYVLESTFAELLLTMQAQNYYEFGGYQNGLDLLIEVANIQKDNVGEQHPEYAATLMLTSCCYRCLQDYDKALECAQKANVIYKETMGEENPEYAASLLNLADIYKDLGDNDTALKYYNVSAMILSHLFEQNHPKYAFALLKIGDLYSSIGEYKKALEYYDVAANIFSSDIRFHKDYFETYDLILSGQFWAYFHLNDTVHLKNIADRLISLTNKYGKADQKASSAIYYLISHDFKCSAKYWQELFKFCVEGITALISGMTENQRETYWSSNDQYGTTSSMLTNMCYIIASRNPSDTTQSTAYDMALLSKGLLLSTSIEFGKVIEESGDQKAIQAYNDLLSLRKSISAQKQKPVAERTLDLEDAERRAEHLEERLVSLSKEYGDFTRCMKLGWQDVQAVLSENEVAIEFVDFPISDDSTMYAALVLRKGWKAPKMVPMFEERQLRMFFDNVRTNDKNSVNKFYNNRYMYELVWGPMDSVLHEGDTVYFSASGMLHKIGIEHLPFNFHKNYTVRRLSSTKQLCITASGLEYGGAVMYGGLEYDMDDATKIAESKKSRGDGYDHMPGDSRLMADAIRGYGGGSEPWVNLPGTQQELDSIRKQYAEHGLSYEAYSGVSGVEETFKGLSGRKVPVLFMATHGFFIPESEVERCTFTQSMQQMLSFSAEGQSAKPDLTLQRSGLVMSGGNAAWMGDSIPDGVEDGILTAQEVSEMDLRGTGLVVLSACETGLGDVSDEGVFGLQRGFKKAGAQTLVMSLWQVSDAATDLMMSTFFRHLLDGDSKYAAFRAAQDAVREEYISPYYWASFIMLD